MKISNLSACIITNKVKESAQFYIDHFNARITFDCGWYVNLDIGNGRHQLQFMSPQQKEQEICQTAGLTYNIEVEDVDAVYQRLVEADLPIIAPLEDHPWGDRGFAIKDPNGIQLYLYKNTEPSEEFKKFYK